VVVLVVAALVVSSTLGLVGQVLPFATDSLLAAVSLSADNSGDALEPSVRSVQIGLTGEIGSYLLVTEVAGREAVLLGTSKGLYFISQGDLLRFISTPGTVTDIALLNDINGDGQSEIIVAIDDTHFPNIRCYNGTSGDKIWHFAPKQDAFLENLLWTEVETPTIDIEIVADINGNGFQDIAATSGYCLYLLDGQTGEQVWRFDADDNLWGVSAIRDLDGDGMDEFIVGAQAGFLYVISGGNGEVVWQRKVAEQCVVFDDKGDRWAEVDRSIWDIIPIDVEGKQKAVVSSEDGKVRLINLEDGNYEWETSTLVEYGASLLYQYYRQKNKLPTSPGDPTFFNFRLLLVGDVSGDNVEDILVSASEGQKAGEGAATANTGLFMINSVTGETIWQQMPLPMESVARVETAFIDGKQVILLPQKQAGDAVEVQLLSTEDGEPVKTLDVMAMPSHSSGKYWAKAWGEDRFILVSNSDDLLCVSSESEVLWHYPRITDVAVETGEFTGDDTPDIFIYSRHRISGWGNAYGARLLYVIDGAARSKAWSYEIPYADLTQVEGITNILVTPDLNGDGKQDVIGYVQPRSSDKGAGYYPIVVFSGRDGSVLLDQPVVAHTYYGLYDQLYETRDSSPQDFPSFVEAMLTKGVQDAYYDAYQGLDETPFLKGLVDDFVQQIITERGEDYNPTWVNDPQWMSDLERNLEDSRDGRKIDKRIVSIDVINLLGDMALVVGCPQDIFIISAEGKLLWTATYNPWAYEDPFFHVSPAGWGFDGEWETSYRSLDDLNQDSIDDLLASSGSRVQILISNYQGDKFNYESDVPQALTLYEAQPGEGIDPTQVELVDDIDGDGIREVSFMRYQEDRPPLMTVVSTSSGDILLQSEVEGSDGKGGFDPPPSADFNNDGYADRVLFSRWREGVNRPVAEVVSGKDGAVLWQYDQYIDCWLFDKFNITELVPVTTISDLNDDGISDLALIKFLQDQPGAIVDVFDVAHDELLREIVIEAIDERVKWERRWHPGAFIKQIGDCNGDGVGELAMLTMLTADEGDPESGRPVVKEVQLVVVDMANGQVIGDFSILGSKFVEIGEENELGVVGLSGEFYFLDVSNNLSITSPKDGDIQTSPIRIDWDGVSPGAFNQVFIDGAEVARTNENEVVVNVARGQHEVVVRSLDEYGRGTYASATFEVSKGSGLIVVVVVGLVISILAAISPILLRIARSRRQELRHGR